MISLTARRRIVFSGVLLFVGGWAFCIGRAIDWALDTWARTWP